MVWRDGVFQMKFLVLGATGMAGHTIGLYLWERGHEVTAFSRRKSFFLQNIVGDVKDLVLLRELLRAGDYDVIINCVGSLNQFAEQDKANAVYVNSFLPHWLAESIEGSKTRLIHMSTDCVFSGLQGNYTESALPDGTSFYDRSKALGEIDDEKNLTFRNSIIGPDMSEKGIGLFNWFMKQRGTVKGYTKAIWSGVTTLTLAQAMEKAALDGLSGLYHLTNNESITKYELLRLFNKYFCNNELQIIPTDGVNADKSLVNTRRDFDFQAPSYEAMIVQMRDWIEEHRALYPHYYL